jgi:hypothetical protein
MDGSLDGAKRNTKDEHGPAPDFASLHPGYGRNASDKALKHRDVL